MPLGSLTSADKPTSRLLFVDDEPALLDGIRNALRRERNRWDMVFAVGPAAALKELEAGEFQVVVSDMRMPGMDGAELLGKVRALQPQAIRFVLSGYADDGAVARASSVAHGFLAKPCDVSALRGTLGRAVALRERIDLVAPPPTVGSASSLCALAPCWSITSRVASGTGDLVTAIERDPITKERFLRMARATFLRAEKGGSDAARVVAGVGPDAARTLLGAAEAFREIGNCGLPIAVIEKAEEHAVLTASLARVMMLDDSKGAHAAFAAGLLHDVGELALALTPRPAAGDGSAVGAPGVPPSSGQGIGAEHGAAGAWLLSAWGFPFAVLEAVAHHHDPPALNGTFGVAWAVHLADELAHAAHDGEPAALGYLDSQRTTVAFMTDLGRRLTAAEQLLHELGFRHRSA